MGQWHICVYAIAKNEAAFVERWVDSMSEADEIYVLDTGSMDATAQMLRARGVRVTEETIQPWRFDTARNHALALLPEDTDICVCTDLDEVFHPGWRAHLEAAWGAGVSQARYRYTWSFQKDGSEGHVFWIEKIHARRGFRWVHPVHEVLAWTGPGARGLSVWAEGVQLDHHPDDTKSRAQYLPLLERSVEEDPEDDRNMHYLGREYLYRKRWDDCIRTLLRHLHLPSANWAEERAASMRYIARAYLGKGEPGRALRWYYRAIAEAPGQREAHLELARMLYGQGDWEGVLYFTACALAIRERPRNYITEAECWGSLPHDLRSIAFFRTDRPELALEQARQALALEPENARLRGNVELLERICAEHSPAGTAAMRVGQVLEKTSPE